MGERRLAEISGRRRPSGPASLYGAMTTVLVLLVAALTVTASQTAPPAIAEFAPQAIQQIKDAPKEQTSAFGGGEGGADGEGGGDLGPGGALPGVTTTSLPPVERARVRRCVGDPPRQTEDPQSPPCVPYWQGNNGGSTYRGVTADSITVAVPICTPRMCNALETYFNKRFEFYGRKLRLLPPTPGEAPTCAERKARAAADDEQLGIFAATTSNYGNAGACYNAELARRKIISVMGDENQFADEHLEQYAPYMWQFGMGIHQIFSATGEMICNRLHGELASRAPDPLLATRQRSYGVILQNVIRDTTISLQALHDAMAKCGASIKPEHVFILSTNDSAGLERPELAQQAVLRLKADNITTVINYGILFAEEYISTAADAQQYFPEWVFSTYGGNDLNVGIAVFWPQASQRQSIMGVSGSAPMRAIEAEPGYWAWEEVDASIDYDRDLSAVTDFIHIYKAMMVLASGIQMAGPNLNPVNFERGLEGIATWPYPLDTPIKSGQPSFRDNHSLLMDFTEYWWSDAAIAPRGYQSYNGAGAVCYVDQARRIRSGQWPTEKDPFFKGPCYTGPVAADGPAAGLG